MEPRLNPNTNSNPTYPPNPPLQRDWSVCSRAAARCYWSGAIVDRAVLNCFSFTDHFSGPDAVSDQSGLCVCVCTAMT